MLIRIKKAKAAVLHKAAAFIFEKIVARLYANIFKMIVVEKNRVKVEVQLMVVEKNSVKVEVQ